MPLSTIDDVTLQAEIDIPADAWAGAVLAHPHPLYGGDMYNNVVDGLFSTLSANGVAVVRFDFRGAGGSSGKHDNGQAERLDVLAAIDALAPYVESRPLLLAGYSFGADVCLAVNDPRLEGWFLVAPPMSVLPASQLIAATDHRPKLLAVPEHDQFNPPAKAASKASGWTNARIETIPGGDHFLQGRMAPAAQLCLSWLRDLAR